MCLISTFVRPFFRFADYDGVYASLCVVNCSQYNNTTSVKSLCATRDETSPCKISCIAKTQVMFWLVHILCKKKCQGQSGRRLWWHWPLLLRLAPSRTPPYTAIHQYRTLDGTDFARARETHTLDNELKRKQKWHNFYSWVMQASSLYRFAHLSKSIEACVLLNNWALLNIINTVNIFLGRLRALFIGTIFGGYWFGQSEFILRFQFQFVSIIILPTLYVTFLGETRV